MEHTFLNPHPLALGVTQSDRDFLVKMKQLEQHFINIGALKRVNIFNGYVMTNVPELYQNMKQ